VPRRAQSRPPPQTPKSRNRHSMPALAAAAACASSRPSCQGNSPMLREALSTTPPRFRDRSGLTPHDDDLRATTQKSRPPIAAFLSWPWLNSLQSCVRHATTAPLFTDTRARRSEERVAPDYITILTAQPTLAADLSCGPPHGQIPIAERAAPPNTSPSRGFVPWTFSDAGRRAGGNVRDGRRPKIFTDSDVRRPGCRWPV